ncbi:hypothetical protein ACFL6P_05580 [Candidatus Latescibacterota bacterium]
MLNVIEFDNISIKLDGCHDPEQILERITQVLSIPHVDSKTIGEFIQVLDRQLDLKANMLGE